ncbi:uncharacterized protein [Diadema setosum]|uniref:uncharacterized protein n=1 Tax=Diadema setosum TaxID=31175 RepID=UPI003B3B41A0
MEWKTVSARVEKGANIEEGYDEVTWTQKMYAVTMATLLYLTNYAQQYLLVGTIFGMANDLEFGATACMVTNETVVRSYARSLNVTYSEFCTLPGRCDANSTSFSPDACIIEYTGMGTLYDILAGPVYLIIEGVSAVPITVLLQAAGVPHIATIASLTVAWSLCTLGTAFVNSYWAVAFLRFLFGIFTGPFTTFIMAYMSLIVKPEVLALAFGAVSFGRVVGNGVGYLFVAASNVLGWRLCYVIAGTVGIILGLAALLMAEPPRDKQRTLSTGSNSSLTSYFKIFMEQQRACVSEITWSVLIPVLLGSMCRCSYGFIMSYNVTNYILTYFNGYNVNNLFYAALVAGSLGCILGGILSDCLRKNHGHRSTLSLLAGLSIAAAVIGPFAFVVDSSVFIVIHGIIIVFSDWSVVLVLAVTSDLAPANCKTLIFALLYLFLYSFGGSFSLLVTPATAVLGLRHALILLCAVILTGTAVANTTALALDCILRKHPARVLNKWKNGMGASSGSEEIPLIAPGRTSMVLNGGTLNNDLNNMHNGM